jgi:hypothetical protein
MRPVPGLLAWNGEEIESPLCFYASIGDARRAGLSAVEKAVQCCRQIDDLLETDA